MTTRRKDGSGNSMHCFRDDHELWREILWSRDKADVKHGANGIEQLSHDSERWLPILIEEVGEVAHALTYDADNKELRGELIDVLAVASAWVAAMDAHEAKAVL